MPYPLALHPHRESDVVSTPQADWAISTLAEWLTATHPDRTSDHAVTVLRVLGIDSPGASELWRSATTTAPNTPESFVLTRDSEQDGLVLIGGDGNGLAYGVLDVLDQLQCADSLVLGDLPLSGTPANRVRGIFRSYVSKVEDSDWFLDKEFWDAYLTELATHRFNRLQLAFGIGVEYGHDPGVTENYLLFSYPFLVDLPEFPVRVVGLSAGERDANLAALRYASSEAARRGIDFFVGFWTNGVELDDGIEGDYTVEGITQANHANYCAAAIRRILEECPGISGVTLRVHYESGVPEPAARFWETVFEGVAAVGRPVALDLHSKGLQAETITAAREAGGSVFVTAKFLAEHLGLPYHQTAIRASELPTDAGNNPDYAAVTRGARRFTRYGYGDYLRRERDYRVVYRHWPGTQRLLLWGDPEFAASYSRAASFGGADGAEFFEPLAYKGRKGSGQPDGRQVYRDAHLADGAAEWRKYRYTYRLLGRLLYDPEADPVQWRRFLTAEFGGSAADAEKSLAFASRIMPLVSTAHGVSAANSVYWPEMYENLGIANGGSPNDYYISDSQPPHTFGSAASLDPEVFTSTAEFVDELEAGRSSGRLTTFDVARRLDDLAAAAESFVDTFASAEAEPGPAASRLIVDVRAQIGLGRFFAAKLRAGVGYELFARTKSTDYLRYAIDRYQLAAERWREVVAATQGYKSDLTFGMATHLRGHWSDRQAAIDADIRDLQAELEHTPDASAAMLDLAGLEDGSADLPVELMHDPVATFVPGREVTVTLGAGDRSGLSVVLHYRHANQAELYRTVDASPTECGWDARIPGSYTDSPFSLIYFFEVRRADGAAWRYPGLGSSLADQPYFVIDSQ